MGEWEGECGFELPDIQGDPVEVTVILLDGTAQTITRNRNTSGNRGPVYMFEGAVENDDFCHILCPPETSRRIQEACGEKIEVVCEGDYRILHYSHWTDGSHDLGLSSMRDWIAEVTTEFEKELELQKES